MRNTFVTISSAGPNRDFSKDTRQQPFWDEHAAFIDQLVEDGFILMGGPLVDEGGAMLIFNAEDENEVREKLKNDPWMQHGILKLESIKRWQIFIDERK
ncbi:MAG: YciI family protein [Candidatus Udaeobacter sp.]